MIGATQLDTPNILNTFNQGVQQGKQNRAQNALSQYAQGAMGGDQNALSQIYSADPQAGMAIQQKATDNQQQQKQIQDADMQRLGHYAGMISSMAKNGDMNDAQSLYKTIYPDAQKILGQNLPPTLDPSMIPHMDQIARAVAGQSKPGYMNVAAGGAVFDPTTGKAVYNNPGTPSKPQLIKTDQGYAWATPGQSVQPLSYGQNGQPQSATSPAQGAAQNGGQGPFGMQLPTPQASVPGSLPQETQGYVQKVQAGLGGAQAFDAQGNPTPQLLASIKQTESGGNPNAVSPKGAQGAYQLMPATASSVGVTNPFDPQQAQQGASTYLSQLYKQFKDPNLAIAAYNAGPGRVSQSLGQSAPSGAVMPEATGKDNLIQTRATQVKQLIASGVPVSEAQRQTYLSTGKLAGDSDAPLSSGEEAEAQALASYKLPLSPYSLSKPAMQPIIQRAMQINPNFSAMQYDNNKTVLNDLSSSAVGKSGGTLTAAQTALDHLNDMADISKQLPNNIGAVNATENAVSSFLNTGSAPAVKAWNQAKTLLAGEASKMIKGGVASEGEVNDMLNNLNPNDPNRNVALAKVAAFMNDKVEEMQQKRDSVLGPASPGTSLLSSKAQQYAKRVIGLDPNNTVPQFSPVGGMGQATSAAGIPSSQAQPTSSINVDSLLQKYGAH